jgi:hypothetical protein
MSALPPGPGIPYGVQTVRLMRQRHTFVPAMHRRYGDVFTLQVAPGPRPMVFVHSPEDIKHVFAGDPKTSMPAQATRSSARSWASTRSC